MYLGYSEPYRTHFLNQNSPYIVTIPPVELPLSLAEVKEHLRLDPTDTSEDSYLTTLIKYVRNFFENYTGRILINTEIKTYRDHFTCCFELRRSKLQEVVSINYLKDSVETLIADTTYYVTEEPDYSRIIIKNDETWPTDADNVFQKIIILFVAGYGATEADIPSDIKIALLNHIARLYENRGDCTGSSSKAGVGMTETCLPCAAKLVYDSYIIYDFYHDSWRC